MIFGMCNIWVILRRNIINYIFTVKNLIFINFLTVKVFGYDVISMNCKLAFFCCSKNSSNGILSGNSNSEKLMKMRSFAMKIYYVSHLRMT